MKTQIAVLTGLILASLSTPAMANYPAKSLGASGTLSWKFTRSPNVQNPTNSPQTVGAACWTRDYLGGMAQRAHIYPYLIMIAPSSNQLYLQPLQGVWLKPDRNKLVATVTTPTVPTEFNELPKDLSGQWFASNSQSEGLETACIDGGITAGLKAISKTHGKPVVFAHVTNLPQSAIQVGSQAYLFSQDRNSKINIRDAASLNAFSRHTGYSGDRVKVLNAKDDGSGYRWYQVEFQGSKAIGWVRGDFIRAL